MSKLLSYEACEPNLSWCGHSLWTYTKKMFINNSINKRHKFLTTIYDQKYWLKYAHVISRIASSIKQHINKITQIQEYAINHVMLFWVIEMKRSTWHLQAFTLWLPSHTQNILPLNTPNSSLVLKYNLNE